MSATTADLRMAIQKPSGLCQSSKECVFRYNLCTRQAFESLKALLCTALVLVLFHSNTKVLVTTVVSKYALGAVLNQRTESKARPVSYVSKAFNSVQKNYAAHNRESLRIISTLWTWHTNLHGRSFAWFTGNSPLKSLQTQNKLLQRQVCWLGQAVFFAFQISFQAKLKNEDFDSLY